MVGGDRVKAAFTAGVGDWKSGFEIDDCFENKIQF